MTDLSVIISARNDAVGCLVTVNSIIQEAKAANFDYDVVIVDNSDDINQYKALKRLVPIDYKQVKIIRQQFTCLFAARETAVKNSSGKYLLFIDSHCLFGRDFFVKILNEVESLTNLGILYGLMCYSNHHEHDAYCDRNIDNFLGIRIVEKGLPSKPFKIPFRGMPFLCTREVFNSIDGYGALSKYRLSWGGGDFLIGLKSALYGYENYLLPTATVIHLGPFSNDRYFPKSYIRDSSGPYPRYTGMLAAAYIIGGMDLLTKRISHVNRRLKHTIDHRLINTAVSIAEDDRRILVDNSKLSYNDLMEIFSRQVLYNIPIISKTTDSDYITISKNNTAVTHKVRIRKSNDNWRDRIINSVNKTTGLSQ